MSSLPQTELDTLLASLAGAISTFQESLKEQNLPPLRSDDIEPHPIDNGLVEPLTYYSRKAVIGFCHNIIALVQNPDERVIVAGLAYYTSAAITVVTEGNPSIVDFVEAAGPDGVDISELAQKSEKDNIKLRTVFRTLITDGYFTEPSFGRIVRNRSTIGLLSNRAVIPIMNFLIRRGLAAGSVLPDNCTKPATIGAPSAFETAHKMHVYEYLQTHPEDYARFQQGMTTIERRFEGGVIPDYDWEKLGPHVTFVDIGSGNGAITMDLLRRMPTWKGILQDTSDVMNGAKEFWKTHAGDIFDSGRISFVVADFLEPTPLPPLTGDGRYVFMIKHVLHNWPDHVCVKILQNLSSAASANSVLLIVNFTPPVPDSSATTLSVDQWLEKVKGRTMKEINAMHLPHPTQLAPGFGRAGAPVALLDGLMLLQFNSRDRTVKDFDEMLQVTPWRVQDETKTRGYSTIIQAGLGKP